MARCPLARSRTRYCNGYSNNFAISATALGRIGVECMRCGPHILRAVMNRSNPFHRCPNITAIRIGTRYGASYQST